MSTLHQLLFDGDPAGAPTIVDHSFESDVDAESRWPRDLRQFHQLGDGTGPAPAEAYSFLAFGDGAAMLRRFAAGTAGRTFSQAIVGRLADLHEVAFPLTRWNGWPAPGERNLRPIDPAELRAACERHVRDMRGRPPAAESAVRILLAAVLANPGMDFSVVGIASADVPQVLFVVRDIVSEIGGRPAWTWTFSTFETGDEPRENLPEFIAMPRPPKPALISDAHRVRVDVTGPAGVSGHARLAGVLYQEYRNFEWAEFRNRMHQSAGRSDAFADRVHRVTERRVGAMAAYVPPRPDGPRVPVRQTEVDRSPAAPPLPPDPDVEPATIPPPHVQIGELLWIRSVDQLVEVLDRGVPPGLDPDRRRDLWRHWKTQMLPGLLAADLPVAERVRVFELVLDLLVGPGLTSPREVDDWLRECGALEVFRLQVADRTHATPGPVRRARFPTRHDVLVVVGTTALVLIGVLLGLLVTWM